MGHYRELTVEGKPFKFRVGGFQVKIRDETTGSCYFPRRSEINGERDTKPSEIRPSMVVDWIRCHVLGLPREEKITYSEIMASQAEAVVQALMPKPVDQREVYILYLCQGEYEDYCETVVGIYDNLELLIRDEKAFIEGEMKDIKTWKKPHLRRGMTRLNTFKPASMSYIARSTTVN